jgi:hypothetical protein
MRFWLHGMIQSTYQTESAVFPVFGLVVAVSLNLSDLRLLGIGQILPNLRACDNRWAVHQIRRWGPALGILATSGGVETPTTKPLRYSNHA